MHPRGGAAQALNNHAAALAVNHGGNGNMEALIAMNQQNNQQTMLMNQQNLQALMQMQAQNNMQMIQAMAAVFAGRGTGEVAAPMSSVVSAPAVPVAVAPVVFAPVVLACPCG